MKNWVAFLLIYPGMNSPKGGIYSGPVTTFDRVLACLLLAFALVIVYMIAIILIDKFKENR